MRGIPGAKRATQTRQTAEEPDQAEARRRFPDDFAFQLPAAEFAGLKSQFVTSRSQGVASQGDAPNSSQIAMSSVHVPGMNPNGSQFATSSRSHRGRAFRPYAFTEHGALTASITHPTATKTPIPSDEP
ncbi:MAG: ORF6N domain-containing protein [Verrucomicrobiota bacterium]